MFSSSLVRIIMYWYRTQKIVLSGVKLSSSYFGVSNGVRQGGILSPKLFSVYIGELSRAWSAAKTGCLINDIYVNHVFYADDLCTCIMSALLLVHKKLIDICVKYNLHNYLTFNPAKWVCIVFEPKIF